MCSYWIVVGDIISRCGWVIIGLLFIDIEGVVVVCVCYCWWRFDFVCGWLVCCVGWGFVCVWLLFVFDCVVFGVCGGGVCVGEGRCCGIGSCLCVGSCVQCVVGLFGVFDGCCMVWYVDGVFGMSVLQDYVLVDCVVLLGCIGDLCYYVVSVGVVV